MSQPFVITGNVEFSVEGLLAGRIEAYDRDLPSLEQQKPAILLLLILLRSFPIKDPILIFASLVRSILIQSKRELIK